MHAAAAASPQRPCAPMKVGISHFASIELLLHPMQCKSLVSHMAVVALHRGALDIERLVELAMACRGRAYAAVSVSTRPEHVFIQASWALTMWWCAVQTAGLGALPTDDGPKGMDGERVIACNGGQLASKPIAAIWRLVCWDLQLQMHGQV